MGLNKVLLIGNVGKDSETRHLDSGVSVSQFTLATSETYTSKTGERVTNTEWHNIVTWRGLADFAEKYIKKGRQVYIEGRIHSRSYDDKNGVKRHVTEIYADSVQLLGKRTDYDDTHDASHQESSKSKDTTTGFASEPSTSDSKSDASDDLPF